MIAVDCQPYSIVEDVGFLRLLKKLKPNYQMPSRKYFSEKIVLSIYGSVFEKVRTVVNEAEHISFIINILTSNSKTSFISLTAHCLNKNFEQMTVVLKVRLVHTLQPISLKSFKIHCKNSTYQLTKCIFSQETMVAT